MFAFYDLETTGTSAAFDQPLQFAGILTDDNLKEVDRINLRGRLSPHILPAPWALAVTGVSPAMLTDPVLPSAFEFSQEVSALIRNWGPATWVGYNTIAFDEPMLRQMFYQNLHPELYLTQMDGNSRLDIMKLVYATWVLANDALNWPTNDTGKISFKLDQLAPANGFVSDNFHDALADVEATIHIAKSIRDRAPEVWAQCLRNRSKDDVLHTLKTGEVLALIERFGASPPRAYFGAYAGQNPDNKNAVAFMDLSLVGPNDIDPHDETELAEAVDASPKRVRTVAINNAPSLFQIDVDDPVLLNRANALKGREDIYIALGKALAGRFSDREAPDEVEEKIYSGFYSNADKERLLRFQEVDWERRVEVAQEFEDTRLKWLASRLVYINRPRLLSEAAQDHWKNQISQRWRSQEPDVRWMTTAKVAKQLSEIANQEALNASDYEMICSYYASLGDPI